MNRPLLAACALVLAACGDSPAEPDHPDASADAPPAVPDGSAEIDAGADADAAPVPDATIEPSPPLRLEPVTSFGGATQAARIVGDTAFVAVGRRVAAYDLAGDDGPSEVAMSAALDGPVIALAVRPPLVVASTGRSAYLLQAGAGTLEGRRLVGLGAVTAVAVAGDRVMTSQGRDVVIHDVTDPARSRVLGTYTARNWLSAITIDGDRAYLGVGYPTSTDAFFEVLDLADPTAPRSLGAVPASGLIGEIVTAGGHAYAATRGGLDVFAVDDAPRRVGTRAGSYASLDVVASEAFVSAMGLGVVRIDVTDPTAPGQPSTRYTFSDLAGAAIDGSRVVAWAESGLPEYNDLADIRLAAVVPGTSASTWDVRSVGSTLVVRTAATVETYVAPAGARPERSAQIAASGGQSISIANGKVLLPRGSRGTGLGMYDPARALAELPADATGAAGQPWTVAGDPTDDRAYVFHTDLGVTDIAAWHTGGDRATYVGVAGHAADTVVHAAVVGAHLIVALDDELLSYAATDQLGEVIDRVTVGTHTTGLQVDGNHLVVDSCGLWRFRIDGAGHFDLRASVPSVCFGGRALAGTTAGGLVVTAERHLALIEVLDPTTSPPFARITSSSDGGDRVRSTTQIGDLIYAAEGKAGVAVYRLTRELL